MSKIFSFLNKKFCYTYQKMFNFLFYIIYFSIKSLNLNFSALYNVNFEVNFEAEAEKITYILLCLVSDNVYLFIFVEGGGKLSNLNRSNSL